MAITSVEEMRGVRVGEIDLQWRRTYRRCWRVLTSTQWDGALAVRQAVPVSLGNRYSLSDDSNTIYEHDDFAFATKISAQIDPACDDDQQWIVTVDYGPYDATQFPESPLNHPIKISWGMTKFERVADRDYSGKAVVNSAGDYFDPVATMDDSRPTLRIVRNERTYDPHYATLWKDKVNKDSFFGFDPGMVKIASIPGELEYNPAAGGFYYQVTYEFEINPDGWEKKILDQGLRTLDTGTNLQKQMLDEDGEPVKSPALLDGSGAKLTYGATPYYMKYKVYEEVSFGPLNLSSTGAPGQ